MHFRHALFLIPFITLMACEDPGLVWDYDGSAVAHDAETPDQGSPLLAENIHYTGPSWRIPAAPGADSKVSGSPIISWDLVETRDGLLVDGRNSEGLVIFAGMISLTIMNERNVVSVRASFEEGDAAYTVDDSGKVLVSSGDTTAAAGMLTRAFSDFQATTPNSSRESRVGFITDEEAGMSIEVRQDTVKGPLKHGALDFKAAEMDPVQGWASCAVACFEGALACQPVSVATGIGAVACGFALLNWATECYG